MATTVTRGHLGGGDGDDVLTGIAQNGTGQIHAYAGGGDDWINLSFASITKFSHGHHVRGDNDGSTVRGHDTFNFRDLGSVASVVVGRIEDFDASRDSLAINGATISMDALKSGSGSTGGFSWKIVNYDADTRDSVSATQQWLLIDTGQGYAFYALEGARVTPGDGASNHGNQEAHFVGANGGHKVTAQELAGLTAVGFVDPQNVVPAGYVAQGGITINDDDNTQADVTAVIHGTASGDLIAAGLNDDIVRAGAGNDVVWGGSGNDKLRGEGGNDTIFGGTGNDHVIGGTGDDRVHGEMGNDVLNGWGGNDALFGDDGNDRLNGQQGNDTLDGGLGLDVLHGGDGDDQLSGGAARDVAFGGNGQDMFVFKPGDLVDWDGLTGTVAGKSKQLDLIGDFEIGQDKIVFDGFANVNSLDDLGIWKTNLNGNIHFTVKVHGTNERILVDVADDTMWRDMHDADNFLFV